MCFLCSIINLQHHLRENTIPLVISAFIKCLCAEETAYSSSDGASYLQVACSGGGIDFNVGGVGVRQLESISQPHDRHITGVSQDLAADVGRIPLPRVDCH